jgi:hypothetical protein
MVEMKMGIRERNGSVGVETEEICRAASRYHGAYARHLFRVFEQLRSMCDEEGKEVPSNA